MSLYEYRCEECKVLFESWKPMARCDESATCPQCGAAGQRVFSSPQRVGERAGMGPEQLRTSKEVWE